MATIRDVAKRANVSVATVSAVITGKKRVSPELRARVEDALEALDYRPNALARGLFTGKTKTIALLVPSIANPGFSKALFGVETAAMKRGYAVFVANTEGSPKQVETYIERLIEMRADGVLIALTWELAQPSIIQRLRSHGLEVVGLSGGRALSQIDCFLGDEERAGYTLGQYLARLGHKHLAFIGPGDSHVAELRLRGIAAALDAAGTSHTISRIATDSYDAEGARRATLELIASGTNFTCLITFNDLMGTSALSALSGQGFAVPEQVSVATFGDFYASLTTPPLTTLSFSELHAGELAVHRLLDRIEEKFTGEPETVRIPLELMIRGSTRAAAGT